MKRGAWQLSALKKVKSYLLSKYLAVKEVLLVSLLLSTSSKASRLLSVSSLAEELVESLSLSASEGEEEASTNEG